jgi:hypothetical protein
MPIDLEATLLTFSFMGGGKCQNISRPLGRLTSAITLALFTDFPPTQALVCTFIRNVLKSSPTQWNSQKAQEAQNLEAHFLVLLVLFPIGRYSAGLENDGYASRFTKCLPGALV